VGEGFLSSDKFSNEVKKVEILISTDSFKISYRSIALLTSKKKIHLGSKILRPLTQASEEMEICCSNSSKLRVTGLGDFSAIG
jgi:hypothetical protein